MDPDLGRKSVEATQSTSLLFQVHGCKQLGVGELFDCTKGNLPNRGFVSTNQRALLFLDLLNLLSGSFFAWAATIPTCFEQPCFAASIVAMKEVAKPKNEVWV